MIEVILLLVPVVITAIIFMRKPKLTIPKEFELVEKEIEQWLRNPMFPSEAEQIPTSGIGAEWLYSLPSKPTATTIAQNVMGLSAKQEPYELDIA